MIIQAFINQLYHIIINDTTSKEERNRHDTDRKGNRTFEGKNTHKDCTGEGKRVPERLGELYKVCQDRCRRTICSCKAILQQHGTSEENTKEDRINLSHLFFLSILYVDAIDSSPSFALKGLWSVVTMIYIQVFNNFTDNYRKVD